MLRIAVWYESMLGRNDGNPLYVTAYLKRVQYFCDVLRKKNLNERLLNYFPTQPPQDPEAEKMASWVMDEFGGLEVEHLRPYGDDLGTYGEFDINIWVDWGEDGLTGILPYEPLFPSHNVVYWASDTHLGYDYRLSVAKRSDIVFCAQRQSVAQFKESGIEASWLPHCVDPLAYPRFNFASKKHDICFIGHVNSENRLEFLELMFRNFPNFFYGQRRFEQASREYARSKIVINKAMKDDLNMRVFEVLGSGSFLLTDEVDSLGTLFESGKHLVTYKKDEEAVQLASDYLNQPDKLREIAEAGYREVIKNHTIGSRVKKILESIKNKEVVNVVN